jgi:Tol biopolymer transport system component
MAEFQIGNSFGTNDRRFEYPDFSSNGRRLLLPFARDEEGVAHAYVLNVDDGSTRAVTPDGVTGPVVLSPDGGQVARNEADGLYIFDVDAGEEFKAPGEPAPGMLVARWSDDSEYVYLTERHATGVRVYRRSLETGETVPLYEEAIHDSTQLARYA